jgi:DNA-binding MarR family transcriptional regulator
LARANRFSRTPGTLALWLGLTKGTVSQTINALEDRGLLTKEPGADRRSVHLNLTTKGREVLSRDRLAEIGKMVQLLEDKDQAQLGTLLEALLKLLIRANRGRPFGICRTCRHFVHAANGPGEHACSLLKVTLSDSDAGQICVEQEAA